MQSKQLTIGKVGGGENTQYTKRLEPLKDTHSLEKTSFAILGFRSKRRHLRLWGIQGKHKTPFPALGNEGENEGHESENEAAFTTFGSISRTHLMRFLVSKQTGGEKPHAQGYRLCQLYTRYGNCTSSGLHTVRKLHKLRVAHGTETAQSSAFTRCGDCTSYTLLRD